MKLRSKGRKQHSTRQKQESGHIYRVKSVYYSYLILPFSHESYSSLVMLHKQ